MFGRRAVVTLAVSAGFIVVVALPAQADYSLVQTKSVSGVPYGKSGKVLRYADRNNDHIRNKVTIYADDTDDRGNRCTETWVDYSTKPHLHFNPGLLVNCSGGKRSVSEVLKNDYYGVVGMAVVVCDVPNTSGPITRNENNCRGNLAGIYLHSGQRYEHFKVNASQLPNGVNIWRVEA